MSTSTGRVQMSGVNMEHEFADVCAPHHAHGTMTPAGSEAMSSSNLSRTYGYGSLSVLYLSESCE